MNEKDFISSIDTNLLRKLRRSISDSESMKHIRQHFENTNKPSVLNIDFNDWNHTCADGCCYTFGCDIYLDGVQLNEQHAEDSANALTVVLKELGYEVSIITK